MQHKSHLQKYSGPNSRYTCPRCGKPRELVLYINEETGQPYALDVGICNRRDKCGYNYTPSQFFHDKGEIREIEIVPTRPATITKFDIIDDYYHTEYYPNTGAQPSNHILHLLSLFGKERVESMQIDYMTGSYRGKVIFWQFDITGKMRTGKVMDYDPKSGHNTGYFNWFHKWNKSVEKELGREFVLKQCLYGEHLLKSITPTRTILLVESYKNTHFVRCLTNFFVVVSTDNKGGFTAERCKPLKGRNVIVLPDCGAYDDWEKKARYISREVGCSMRMSTFLEERATEEQKGEGYDIADWIQDQILFGRSLVDIENEFIDAV